MEVPHATCRISRSRLFPASTIPSRPRVSFIKVSPPARLARMRSSAIKTAALALATALTCAVCAYSYFSCLYFGVGRVRFAGKDAFHQYTDMFVSCGGIEVRFSESWAWPAGSVVNPSTRVVWETMRPFPLLVPIRNVKWRFRIPYVAGSYEEWGSWVAHGYAVSLNPLAILLVALLARRLLRLRRARGSGFPVTTSQDRTTHPEDDGVKASP